MEIEQVLARYTLNNTQGGTQQCNLSTQQQEGLESLSKRLAKDNLVILPTDKSTRLCVQTKESYVHTTEPHIGQDIEVTQAQFAASERILNAHTLQISRFLQLCEGKGDTRRTKMALVNSNIEPRPEKQ